jgi:hypothetical protein
MIGVVGIKNYFLLAEVLLAGINKYISSALLIFRGGKLWKEITSSRKE